jgi:hypothetical protein
LPKVSQNTNAVPSLKVITKGESFFEIYEPLESLEDLLLRTNAKIDLYTYELFKEIYCNKCVLSLTHTLILNVCLTMSMHGLLTSTQHLDKTLEPLNWIRVCPSHHNKHSHERSHVQYCESCKYTTFMTQTRPSF